jgi:Flp pilus assembly protein protease CpaA
MTMNHSSRDARGSGFPLSNLFLLIAACAVMLTMIAPLVRGRLADEIGTNNLVVASIGGGLAIMTLGMLLGMFQHARLAGVAWGTLLGGLIGLAYGPLMFLPLSNLPWLLLTSLGGAALILGLAAFARREATHAMQSPPATRVATKQAATAPVRRRHPLDPDPEDEPAQ